MRRAWAFLMLLLIGSAVPAGAGLEELAARADWERVVEVARRRGAQLPLRPDEAFIAAVAAGAVGDREAEIRFLELASTDGPLAAVARVELAGLVAAEDGARAIELIEPELRHPSTGEVQEAAAAAAAASLDGALPGTARAALERVVPALPRDLRRSLQVQLARTAGAARRRRLGDVLDSSTGDLAALAAARALLEEGELGSQERWWVAQAMYRHAMYAEAQRLLTGLAEDSGTDSVPRWRVAFLTGRCAFRRDDFVGAEGWYRRAIAHAGGGERGADLQIHLARALELEGKLDDAVAAAQRAVRLRPTDERRLFLARLRLRLDQPDYARYGIARVRSRTSRDRGQLLLALHELAVGEPATARVLLADIGRRPWSAAAAVIAARVAAADGDWPRAEEELDTGGSPLPPFWAAEARALLEHAPRELVEELRQRQEAAAGAGTERARRRALGRWAALEVDEERLRRVRTLVAAHGGLEAGAGSDAYQFEPGLAEELWRRGLAGWAVRWDPSGLPRKDAGSALWSAHLMLEHGAPGGAIVMADAAWRMAGGEIPARGYPEDLSRALYPLPFPDLVRAAAAAHGVPWPLVAALAREESRWSPDALSAVGARGLLQLLPDTATAVAGRLGRPLPDAEDLFDPWVSLDLGAAELARLIDAYGGRWAPAVAAYNAGEAQAALWLDECGGACDQARYVAIISFAVTRAYTSDVLTGAGVYSELYGAASDHASVVAARRLLPP